VEGTERPPSAIHDITRELSETNCSDSIDATCGSKLAVNVMEGTQNVYAVLPTYGKELVGRSVVGTVRSIIWFHVQEFI
jgi:ArsR family metal-binding transcriptional regulator